MTQPDAQPHNTPDNSEIHLVACPGCDMLFRHRTARSGHHLVCDRCGSTVARSSRNSVLKVLVFSLTGLILFVPAIFMPLMTLSSIGMSVSGNVLESALAFFQGGYPLVAVMVTITAVIMPFLKLLLSFLVALHIRLKQSSGWLRSAFRLLLHLDEWGMVEIYLLGILVSLIKIHSMASIEYHLGFFCFIALVFLSVAASGSIDRDLFWRRIGNNREVERRLINRVTPGRTAYRQGLMRCHDCGFILPKPSGSDKDTCPRCNSVVHPRIKSTIQKTWALVITSFIFIFPANILPIMEVNFLGIPDRSTILDGIIYFFKEGSYGIGLIIFLASVLVPVFKIIGLVMILLTIQFRRDRFLRQKASMYRFIEFIGRWSMLDIFVIALLTVLVDFGFFSSIHTAPGATFFCIVVVCTMMAAIVYDPRTMWDACRPPEIQPTDSIQ